MRLYDFASRVVRSDEDDEDQIMIEDAARARRILADTITLLVREGFTATSAAAFAVSGDPNDLVHTGAVSVQLFK